MRAWDSTTAIKSARIVGGSESSRFLYFAASIGSEAEAAVDDRAWADDVIAERQELDRGTKAIADLPVALKEPLVLRTIEGLSKVETGSIQSISEKASNPASTAPARSCWKD